MLEDRLDRAVAGGADVIAEPAGGFEPCRAVAPGEAQNAETGAEALFGMRLGLHDRLDERNGGGTDRAGLTHHPHRRPRGIAPVSAWHVLRYGGVAMPEE